MIGPERAQLFLAAQDAVWADVCRELAAGQKTSHWMWFVFPQLAALGRSATAKRFGLRDLDEAAEYLAHPVLGARLQEAAGLMLRHAGQDPARILGSVDALKLRSCATLFARTPSAPGCFRALLEAFHGGEPCPLTLAELNRT